jgi:hypothetical protein
MAFSRQFRALLTIAGFFAGTWAVAGAAIGAVVGSDATGETALAAAVRFALMYATAGGIAGVTTAWLTARAETGRDLSDIPTWRLAGWGVLGGMAPAAMFGLLGLVAGAPASAVLPLLGLGVVGGGVSGLVAGSASAAAKRVRLADPDTKPGITAP